MNSPKSVKKLEKDAHFSLELRKHGIRKKSSCFDLVTVGRIYTFKVYGM